MSGPPYSPAYPPGQTSAFPAVPYAQGGYPPGTPGYAVAAPPKKKRGLMITLIVLAVTLVLCGGGGTAAYFVIQGADGKGQPAPVDAVNAFLKAIYTNKDVEEASRYVCSTARDKETLTKRVDDLRTYEAKLKVPTYTWPTPTVDEQTADNAKVSATVKLTTSDDRNAEVKLRFVAVKDDGWWVCEITGG